MSETPSDVPAVPAGEGAAAGPVSPELERLVDRAADPEFERVLSAVAQEALTSHDDSAMAVRAMLDSLSRYFQDWSTASLLVTTLAYWEDADYVQTTLAPLADSSQRDRLEKVLHRLAALFGRQIRVGYDLATRDPDDWQYIDARVLYDLERAEWSMAVTLRSFAQRESKIVGPPLSFLRLVNRLLTPLLSLEAVVAEGELAGLFDEEAVSGFLDLGGRLAAALQASTSPADPTDAEGPS